MRISHFDHAEDNVPKQMEMTWDFFTAKLGPHEYRPGGETPEESQKLKEACPCFSPAEYPDGATRSKKNVLRVWMLVLDVDHIDEATAHWVVGRLQAMNLAAVVYSSWSHARDPWRFRVVIPLDKPVPGPEWPGFWARAITLFNSVCDKRCKDASRIYFGPFAPIGSEHLNFYHVYQGAELPVDYVMSLPLPQGASEASSDVEQVRSKDVEAVAALVAAWPNERRHEAHLALAGGLLSSGFSNDRALDFLCAVARGQDPDNEDREKRQSMVEHTREQLDANENITGWTTLAPMLGPNGDEIVSALRELLEPPPELTPELFDDHGKYLRKRRIDRLRDLGHTVAKVIKGETVEHEKLLGLADELGRRFATYEPESVAKLLVKEGQPQEKLTELTERIDRAQGRAKQTQAEGSRLILGENGPKACLANTLHVLTMDKAWKSVLAFDEFAGRVVKLELPPVREGDGTPDLGDWNEHDTTRAIAWIASKIAFEPSLQHFESALVAAAKLRRLHPIQDYLNSLQWDGVPRLDLMLPEHFGCDDTRYTRFVGAKWMLGAVARAMDPGCKVDHVLILESKQGWEKSSKIRKLAPKPEWSTDSEIPIGEKDAYIVLLRKWLIEVAEFDGYKGRDATAMKRFMTSQVDNFRPPYARANQDFPRQCVFVGTTNAEDGYLPDRENRRYWPVRCRRRVDGSTLEAVRDQLWAEAVYRYQAGERWWPDTPELEALCTAQQDERGLGDDWEGVIEEWLTHSGAPGGPRSDAATKGITSYLIQGVALDLKKRDMNRTTATRVGIVMAGLGWTRRGRERRYFPPPDWATRSGVAAVAVDAVILAKAIGFGPGVHEANLCAALAQVPGGQFWDQARAQAAKNHLIHPGVKLTDGTPVKLQTLSSPEQPWTLRCESTGAAVVTVFGPKQVS